MHIISSFLHGLSFVHDVPPPGEKFWSSAESSLGCVVSIVPRGARGLIASFRSTNLVPPSFRPVDSFTSQRQQLPPSGAHVYGEQYFVPADQILQQQQQHHQQQQHQQQPTQVGGSSEPDGRLFAQRGAPVDNVWTGRAMTSGMFPSGGGGGLGFSRPIIPRDGTGVGAGAFAPPALNHAGEPYLGPNWTQEGAETAAGGSPHRQVPPMPPMPSIPLQTIRGHSRVHSLSHEHELYEMQSFRPVPPQDRTFYGAPPPLPPPQQHHQPMGTITSFDPTHSPARTLSSYSPSQYSPSRYRPASAASAASAGSTCYSSVHSVSSQDSGGSGDRKEQKHRSRKRAVSWLRPPTTYYMYFFLTHVSIHI